MDKDGHDGRVDGLQVVGSMKLVDGELLHQRVVVTHLLLSFLQTCQEEKLEIMKNVLYGTRKLSTLRAVLIKGYKYLIIHVQ